MKYIAIVLCFFILISCGAKTQDVKSVTTLDMNNIESKELQKKIEGINADNSLTVDEKVKKIRVLVESKETTTEKKD